jgi:histone acetyltransferase
MPSDYIMRVVFSSRTDTMAVFENGIITAGATYRLFIEQEFAELIFFCVTEQKHGERVGTYLMNQLKANFQVQCVHHILVYADETAIGFFEGQGFSKDIQFDPVIWQRLIQSYSGSQLLYCAVSTEIDYANSDEWRAAVEEFVSEKMPKGERLPFVKGTVTAVAGIAVRDPGEVPPADLVNAVLGKVRFAPMAGFFRHLLTAEAFPDFHKMISNPMALDTIDAKHAKGGYQHVQMLLDDLFLMVHNTLAFNEVETRYHRAATGFRQFLVELIDRYQIDYGPPLPPKVRQKKCKHHIEYGRSIERTVKYSNTWSVETKHWSQASAVAIGPFCPGTGRGHWLGIAEPNSDFLTDGQKFLRMPFCVPLRSEGPQPAK